MVAAWFEDGCATGFSASYPYGAASNEDIARLPLIEAEIAARLGAVRLDCAVGLACGVGIADDGYAA